MSNLTETSRLNVYNEEGRFAVMVLCVDKQRLGVSCRNVGSWLPKFERLSMEICRIDDKNVIRGYCHCKAETVCFPSTKACKRN